MTDRKPLADRHAQLIRDSAISDEVRDARGYWTAVAKHELRDLGFGQDQHRVPALVIPIWDVHGEQVLSQIRPDDPRSGSDGRKRKYEEPSRSRAVLDVPPTIRHLLGTPDVPLLITEGARKADSAASIGLCCISVAGVWKWRGTNDQGGSTVLAAFESIALKGRQTYVTFDSDVMTKPGVHEAMRRLKGVLESRGASVHIIYLPSGANGEKVGLDDYLAAGHSKDELLALATDKLRQPESREPNAQTWELGDYRMAASEGIFLRDREGALKRLTDFAAFVKRKVVEDDGVEQRQRYELVVQQGNRIESVSVLATEFENLRWTRRLNTLDPYVAAGTAVRDHARAAIDLASQGTSTRAHVYTHLGWRRIDGQYMYLHAGGAIGAQGSVPDVLVELSSDLERFKLPDPPYGEAEREAVRQSLGLLELAPDRIMVPLLAATFRAPLGYVDNTTYLNGQSGVQKSELTALAQQHFGPELYREHLPGSWGSTANSLRAQLFLAKDALFVVDDYAPGGGRIDRESWERKAAEILRAQGNAAGRGRAAADGGLRPIKPPRALLVTSGEDVPSGLSVRARNVIVDVIPGDVDLAKLTAAQRAAVDGVYAEAMSGYLRWLAPQLDEIHTRLRDETAKLRDQLRGVHSRTPTAIAQLAVGMHYLLAYVEAVSVLDHDGREQLWARCLAAFEQLATAQTRHQEEAEPTARFFDLLSAAITSGRAHTALTDGSVPEPAEAWGWRLRTIGTGDYERVEWQPQGDRVGWVDSDNLYLSPEASYRAAQLMNVDGAGIGVGQKTLSKRLKDKGLLLSVGTDRPATEKRAEGRKHKVLHVHAEKLRAMCAEKPGTSGTPGTQACANVDLNSREGSMSPISVPDPANGEGSSGTKTGDRPTPNGGSAPDVPGVPGSAGTEAYGISRSPRELAHERLTHGGRPVEWWPRPDGSLECGVCHPQPWKASS